jgi:hypothetical protein
MYGQEHLHVRFVTYSMWTAIIQQEMELFATSDTQTYPVGNTIYGSYYVRNKKRKRRNEDNYNRL